VVVLVLVAVVGVGGCGALLWRPHARARARIHVHARVVVVHHTRRISSRHRAMLVLMLVLVVVVVVVAVMMRARVRVRVPTRSILVGVKRVTVVVVVKHKHTTSRGGVVPRHTAVPSTVVMAVVVAMAMVVASERHDRRWAQRPSCRTQATQGDVADLDGVGGAASELGCNERPLAAHDGVLGEEDLVFLLIERPMLEGGVEVMEPSLAALFCGPALDVVGNVGPVRGLSGLLGDGIVLAGIVVVEVVVELIVVLLGKGLDEVGELSIFSLGPIALHETGLEDLGPMLEALCVCAAGDHLRNSTPVSSTMLLHGSTK